MNQEKEVNALWLSVIARSLAYLCISQTDLKEKSLNERVLFLDNLGLPRKDAAQMLGITDKSFTEVLSRARKITSKRSNDKKSNNK